MLIRLSCRDTNHLINSVCFWIFFLLILGLVDVVHSVASLSVAFEGPCKVWVDPTLRTIPALKRMPSAKRNNDADGKKSTLKNEANMKRRNQDKQRKEPGVRQKRTMKTAVYNRNKRKPCCFLRCFIPFGREASGPPTQPGSQRLSCAGS